MRHKKIFRKGNKLSQYSERAYMESDRGKGSTPSKPPKPLPKPSPPPAGCLLDIVIGIDFSGSMGDVLTGTIGNQTWIYGEWGLANDFVREFVTGLDAEMDGSIGGVAGSGTSNVQVGAYLWTHSTYAQNYVVTNMTTDSQLIEGYTNLPNAPGAPGTILGHQISLGLPDDEDTAVTMGMTMLNNFGTLGNRSSQANYRRIMIIVTDARDPWGCDPFNPTTGAGFTTNMLQDVWNVGTNAGTPELDVEVYVLAIHALPVGTLYMGSQPIAPVSNYLTTVSCLTQNPSLFPVGTIDHGTGNALGVSFSSYFSNICTLPTWLCSGANTTLLDLNNNPVNAWTCYDDGLGTGNPSQLACDNSCSFCLDPTNPFNQIPYAYRTSWWHDPNDLNMNYTNTITLPGPFPLPQPPYIPNQAPTSYWQPGTIFTLSQLNDLINEPNSIVGPWINLYPSALYPNPPTPHPSHVRMENPTANLDYANQWSICEWCTDWIAGTPSGINPTGTPSLPGAFDQRVLNWPLWIANSWGSTEAEAMCDCCPAIDPGFTAWPFPPQNGAVIAEWTGYH